MSQRRYVNFGTDADAAKVKAISAIMAAPQVMRASEPFMQALAPDSLVVAPHAVVFDGGMVLDETEQLVFTVPTGFSAADYTLAYQHIDEDIIGGTAATIDLLGGLQASVANGVILGWVRYPGGSVPIDSSMLFPNRVGRLRPERLTREQYDAGTVVTVGPDVTVTQDPQALLAQTIPASPYQIALNTAYVSELLAYEDQRVAIFDHATGLDMTRIETGTPITGQFLLDTGTGIATFAAVDTGHTIDIVDMTYGASIRYLLNSSATTAQTVDTLHSFPVTESPFNAFTAEYVPYTTGYTATVVAAYDVENQPIVTAQSIDGPLTPDGSIARLMVRFLDGTRNGTAGQSITVRLRQTVPAVGAGLLLRARATTYDLPF